MVKHRYFLINFCYVKNNANKFVFLNLIHNHISFVVLLSCWPFETLNANKTSGIMRTTWYSILLRNISYLWYTFKEAYIAASLKLRVNMGLLMRMLSFHRCLILLDLFFSEWRNLSKIYNFLHSFPNPNTQEFNFHYEDSP